MLPARPLALAAAALGGAAAALALRPLVPAPAPPPALVAEGPPAAHRSPPAAGPVVYVAGAVAHPGVYRLAAGARAADAVDRAGGALRDADLVAVNLAAPLADGDEVAVRRLGEATPRARHTRAPKATSRRARGAHRRSADPAPDALPAALVDLNRADAATLATLPGIGPGIAERIVAFRELNGPFASIDNLLDVGGITPSRLDRAAPFLTLQP